MKNIRINNPRKNYYTVVADTDEFGINEVMFEGISLEECIAYIKANTKAQKKPLWAVGVETERTHRRHYVVVRSRDASTAWNQVYRHGYNNGYLCVDRINISAESPATTAAEQEQEAPAVEQAQTTQPTEKPQEATTAPAQGNDAHSAQPMQEAAQNAPQAAYNAPMNGAGTPRTGAA